MVKIKYSFFFLIGWIQLSQAQILIEGNVYDNKEEIPFANIQIKELNVGTSSDSKGNFKLEIPPGNYTIEVTAMGYHKFIKKIQVVQNVDDTLTIDLLKLNADGTSSGLTTAVSVDLLADSYVSTLEGIVLTGASPDFTREQFLAHTQARLNDALNQYAVTKQTGASAGGVVDKAAAFSDALLHLILPVLSIAFISTASMIRITRRSIIDVLNKPFIIAARSKGLSSKQIFFRHVLRNALLPILPLMAMQITTLITNAMIVETLFSWPGIGNWLIQAIYQRDYSALRMGMLAVSTLVVMITIAIDLFNRTLFNFLCAPIIT